MVNTPVPPLSQRSLDRIFAKVNMAAAAPEYAPYLGPCWTWNGAKDAYGYGVVTRSDRCYKVHRLTYAAHFGPIPDDRQIDHLCRVRECCNPNHLEAVDQRTNLLRGAGPSAKHAAKTHCVRGHEFNAENTIIRKNGSRWCRACGRVRYLERKEKLGKQNFGESASHLVAARVAV